MTITIRSSDHHSAALAARERDSEAKLPLPLLVAHAIPQMPSAKRRRLFHVSIPT